MNEKYIEINIDLSIFLPELQRNLIHVGSEISSTEGKAIAFNTEI